MYDFTKQIGQCYRLLQDDLSKKIFWARLTYEFELSVENLTQLVRLGEQQKWLDTLMKNIFDTLPALEQNRKKLILYGTSVTGQAVAAQLSEKQVDFYGFCDRKSKEYTNGLMGKPVISPDELFQKTNQFHVIVTAAESHDEILGILEENHFPQNQILSFRPVNETDHQYFEFPELFRPGTAFVDGGCLDCRNSYHFVDWCKSAYTKIFAFEPDPISCSICEKRLSARDIRGFRLISAGLSDHTGEVTFQTGLYECSHIVEGGDTDENTVAVPVTTIDGTVGEEQVGFIKMDIEGAEFDALHGAKATIVRDKPLMAVSVYHRRGDMLAIMDYLHNLVPEYHFWLRHYSIGEADTVLYASTDTLAEK